MFDCKYNDGGFCYASYTSYNGDETNDKNGQCLGTDGCKLYAETCDKDSDNNKPKDDKKMKSIPLSEYIETEYKGNKAEFARDFGMMPQNVNHFISKTYFVIDGVLWKKSKYQQGES